jgi:hypothetical protein
MNCQDNVGDNVAGWSDDCYSTLPESHVDRAVDDACERVTDERREEDERDDCVTEVIVLFKLKNMLGIEPDNLMDKSFVHMGSMPFS